MRYLLTILFFFIAYVVNAQYIPNSAAYQYKGLKQTNSLQPPTGAAFPVTATNAPDSNYAAWFYNTLDTSFYQFNPIPKTWTRLHASGGIQVDSVFISSIDSIYITNTDSIFIITNNNDTIFIGSGNPAVDTIYQRGPDSIFAVKSGVEFLAAVTGASAPTGGMDTAYTRSDSILGVKNNGEFLISEVQASIDSIFITHSDSIFIITGNDTIFVGQANAMDSAYLRGDSIFGTKGGNEFFIALTGNASISLLPLSPGYGIIGSDYNGTSPQTWAIDTSILNNVIFIDSSSIEFFVDSIANTPIGTEASGTKYLVGTSPSGVFTGHANEIATLIGAVWSFTIPVAGDNLVVSNETQPTSFYQFDGANWNLTRRSASIGGDAIGANYDLGTLDNRSFRFLTNGAWKEVISAAGSHYFRRYVGASSNNYLKIVDTATGRMDTASFTPLVLTTNGSAGASTLSGDTLNIPIYTGAGPHNDTLYYNVEWFGAVHDSVTDDGPAIQAGVDYIHNYAPGAILFFPAGNYRDTSHVHWRSKVNALGEGEASNIFNDLPTHTRFADQAPIFFGNLTPASWDSTDLRYFSASYANANKVKVVDSISRFAVGDIVIMRGATFWLNTDGQVRPHVVRENRVVSINGDTLYLEEPLDTVITKIAISGHYIAGSGKRLDAYGELAQFISDCSINNLKLTSVYGDVALGIAMFKCNFNNVWTYGKESLGGNGESFCSFNNIYATFSKQAWENSIGTHNTTVNFLRANWNGIEDAENKPVVKFGESVYAVDFTNLHINANGFDGKGIWFGAATHSSVNGFTIKGEGMNDNLIEFSNSNNVISNIVRNGKIFSSTSSHYIEIEKNAGVNARLDDNLIEHVEAYGNTGANGVVIDGTNTTIKDSYFEDGNLSFGDSLVNYKIDNTTINGGYYLSKSNITTSGIIDVTGGLKLTTSAGTPGTDSVLVQNNGIVKRISPTYYSTGGGGGSGTVTSFSSGDLSPLFTTSVATATTTPALTFALTNAAANTVLGNATGSSSAPSYGQIVNGQITNATIVATTKLSATGTPSSSTALFGDNTWKAALTTAGLTNRYVPYFNSTALANSPIYIDSQSRVDINSALLSTTANNPVLNVAPGTLRGTIATTASAATVTGTGTEFLTDYKVGDNIWADGQLRLIATITSNTAMTTNTNWSNTVSGIAHKDSSVSIFGAAILNNGSLKLGSSQGPIYMRFPYQNVYIGNSTTQGTTSSNNVGIGYNALTSTATLSVAIGSTNNTSGTGASNTSVGNSAFSSASSGANNAMVGYFAGGGISTGSFNSIVGSLSISNANVSNVSAFGYQANRYNYDGFNFSTSGSGAYVGFSTRSGKVAATNENVFGYDGRGNGDNTSTIGNPSTVSTFLSGAFGNPMYIAGSLVPTPSSSGGLVPAGTWYYVVTAVDALGNTTAYLSQASTTVTTGTTSSVSLALPTLPPGAVSFNVYRCVAFAAPGASTLVATGVTSSPYVDVSASTSSGTPSLLTTAFINKFSATSGGDSWINNGGKVGIGTNQPAYTLDVTGSIRATSTVTTAGRIVGFAAKTSTYTILATDEVITGDATSAAFNVTLPTAVGRSGQRYTVKKIDASANAVTVNTTSSQTIDGSTTYSLASQYKFVSVVSNGANWLIIGNN